MSKGLLVNKTKLGEILGVTHATLTAYQKNGMPIHEKGEGKGQGTSNYYDTRKVIDWYVQHMIERKFGRAEHVNEALNKEYEQARLAKAQADGKDIDNQIKRGELAPVGLMTKVLAHVSAQIVSVLDSIPQKIKRRVPKMTATEIEIIKKEIAKTQNAAAKIEINLDELVQAFVNDKDGLTASSENGTAKAE